MEEEMRNAKRFISPVLGTALFVAAATFSGACQPDQANICGTSAAPGVWVVTEQDRGNHRCVLMSALSGDGDSCPDGWQKVQGIIQGSGQKVWVCLPPNGGGNDMTAPADMATPPDQVMLPDLTPVPDLTPTPDMTPVPDLTPTPDMTPLPDLAVLPDLTPQADLAPPPPCGGSCPMGQTCTNGVCIVDKCDAKNEIALPCDDGQGATVGDRCVSYGVGYYACRGTQYGNFVVPPKGSVQHSFDDDFDGQGVGFPGSCHVLQTCWSPAADDTDPGTPIPAAKACGGPGSCGTEKEVVAWCWAMPGGPCLVLQIVPLFRAGDACHGVDAECAMGLRCVADVPDAGIPDGGSPSSWHCK